MHIKFVHLGREHLGIEYLSAVLRRAGHRTSLAYDPGLFSDEDNVFQIGPLARLFSRRKLLVKEILNDPPDLLAFSIYSSTYRWAVELASEIKTRLAIPIVAGGPHPSLVPKEVAGNECFDYVIAGEAEEALLELVDVLESGGDPGGLDNLASIRDGAVVFNPVRRTLCDLDTLPLPDKSLFEGEVNFRDDYLVLCSRGCPFSCSYCGESARNKMYDNRFFRRRSVEAVMEELNLAQAKYEFKEVNFNDSILLADKKWLYPLLERFSLEIGVPFRCYGKVQFLDDEMAGKLKEWGCSQIEFGVQSLDEDLRRNILDRRETNEQLSRALALLDKHGLRYDLDHMFNLPTETTEQFVKAARFYVGLKHLNRIKNHFLIFFPNTPIIEIALEHKVIDEQLARTFAEGEIGDFFHDLKASNPAMEQSIRAFAALFRFIPLISPRRLEWLLKNDRVLKLARLPGFAVILGQILVAIHGRDYRYYLYIAYYAFRIRRRLALFFGSS